MIIIRLWIDDVRPAPDGYKWCYSVNETKEYILNIERLFAYHFRRGDFKEDYLITLIAIDYDSGDYEKDGGPYIKLMDWLEETGRSYPIHIHSRNPVGIENMRRIIRHNSWKEIV